MATGSIRITKICQWCGVEFEAQKVSTKYCSHRCANLSYKQAVRDKRVKQAEAETLSIKLEKPREVMKFGNVYTPLIDLITTRYEEQLYTIFTTNLTPAQLKEKYGKRIVDRLNEMVEKVVFENESYRR